MADTLQSAAPVLLCRQSPDHVLGISAAQQGRKVLLTVQGDGVVSYDTSRLASSSTKALGSSQAQLLAPVQQLDGSYVAAVQPHGSAQGLLVCTPAKAKHPRPLLEAEQQLALPSALHSVHVLSVPSSSTSHESLAAVVLADGTVGTADYEELVIRQCSSNAASAVVGRTRGGHGPKLAAASTGQLLALAKQVPGAGDVTVDVYAAMASNSNYGRSHAGAAAVTGKLQLRHSCSIPCPSSSSKLADLSMSASLLAVLWNDGSVTTYHKNLAQMGSQPDHVATFQLPEPLKAAYAAAPGSQQASKKRKAADEHEAAGRVLCTALSDNHLLLVVVQSAAQVHYAVLDSRYGCCLTSDCLALEAAEAGKLQLLPLPGQPSAPAALLLGGAVFLLNMQLPKADLAGLVSTLALTSTMESKAQTPIAAALVSQPVAARQHINLTAVAAAVGSSAGAATKKQQQQQCTFEQLSAQDEQQHQAAAPAQAVSAAAQKLSAAILQQPVPAADLKQAAQQLCTALQQQLEQANNQVIQQPAARRGKHSQQQRQQSHVCPAAVSVSQRLLGRGFAALAEAQEWQLLRQLHSLQPLQSLTHCPGLLQCLVAGQQYALLRQIVAAAQDIPGESLVQAMQQLLSQHGPEASAAQQHEAEAMRAAAEAAVHAAEAAVKAGDVAVAPALLAMARRAAAAVDSCKPVEMLLHVLLAAHIDSVEVQAALASLPTPVVLRLLKALQKWVAKYSSTALRESPSYASWEAVGLTGEQWNSSAAQALLMTPSWGQVLEWSRLVLDAHLTRLALLPAAGKLLRQLQDLLQPEVGATSKLVKLKGVVDHMVTNGPLPAVAEAANSEYTLELLDLRVAGK